MPVILLLLAVAFVAKFFWLLLALAVTVAAGRLIGAVLAYQVLPVRRDAAWAPLARPVSGHMRAIWMPTNSTLMPKAPPGALDRPEGGRINMMTGSVPSARRNRPGRFSPSTAAMQGPTTVTRLP